MKLPKIARPSPFNKLLDCVEDGGGGVGGEVSETLWTVMVLKHN